MAENYIVCTDPGVDDLISLALLRKLSPSSSHSLIPTFTNGPIDIVSKNAREFVSFCAPNWSMAKSCSLPLSGTVERPFPDYFHGPDAVWNVHIDPAEYEASDVADFAGELSDFKTGISLGTMTAFSPKSPDFGGDIDLDTLWVMGGVMDEEGNETDFAETNIAFDPDGADTYFAEPTAKTTYVVPLDVTRKVVWDQGFIDRIEVKDATSWWLKNAVLAWFKNYDHSREESLCLHDPLTVWLAFHPGDAVWEETGVRVVLEGEERGRTVRDDSRPKCFVACGLKDPAGLQQKIWDTIFS